MKENCSHFLLSFETQPGFLVEIGQNDIEKLFNHWKKLVKKTGGELEFPNACSGVNKSTRELVDQSTKSITFFTKNYTFNEPKWVQF